MRGRRKYHRRRSWGYIGFPPFRLWVTLLIMCCVFLFVVRVVQNHVRGAVVMVRSIDVVREGEGFIMLNDVVNVFKKN